MRPALVRTTLLALLALATPGPMAGNGSRPSAEAAMPGVGGSRPSPSPSEQARIGRSTFPAGGGEGLEAVVLDTSARRGLPLVFLLPGGNGPAQVGTIFPHHIAYAERLARAGFRAVAIDYHAPQRPLLDSLQIADIGLVIDSITARFGGRPFVVGFSMGGANALRVAASRRDVAGLVCYFAPVSLPRVPVRQPIDYIPDLVGATLVIQGGADVVTDTAQYRMLIERLAREGKPFETAFFPEAAHGFTYQGAPAGPRIRYDAAASDSSIARVIGFIARRAHR